MVKKNKYYAVRVGKIPGIYITWNDCKANVHGFPGAVFKSFEDIADAESFLKGSHQEKVSAGDIPAAVLTEKSAAVAYVDGSYNSHTKEYSYGVVMFYDGDEKHFSEKFSDPEMAGMRNVAGEIEGSKRAMRFCLENNIDSIDIYYDYAGIEAWCTGDWRTNKTGTIQYKSYYDKISETVRIRFIKVKGHSGDKYNDVADKLAKQALGIKS